MESKIAFLVSNDLNFDQRMIKICTSLSRIDNYEISLIGRAKQSSKPLHENTNYRQVRLSLFFEKGIFFYVELFVRQFFYLMTKRYDAVCAIDLDTILAARLYCKLFKAKFIYDAHEYFTEVPELVERPRVQKIWKWVEKWTVPYVDAAYTVNQSLATLFYDEYKVQFEIIRNVPTIASDIKKVNAATKIIIYQGAINEGRGLEALILAMKQFQELTLWIIGDGDLLNDLKALSANHQIENVKFLGYVYPHELKQLTAKAWLGANLLENKGLNYYYSLANKTFDYMHAGIPMLNMNFPEYKYLNRQFEVAILLDDLRENTLIAAISTLLNNENLYKTMEQNCHKAANAYNWSIEEKKLITLYQKILS
ncbi:MAG: glycosyltransferase [Saprospiraceae bacterium]|nr:glycosyltransferase [Saprospiraceae bacterium]